MAGLLSGWRIDDPNRNAILDAAKSIGWSESSGMLPGEWAQQQGKVSEFQGAKYTGTGGAVGVAQNATGNATTNTGTTNVTQPTTPTTPAGPAGPTGSSTTGGNGLMTGVGAGSWADSWKLTADQVAQLANITNYNLAGGGGQIDVSGNPVGGLGKHLADLGVTDPYALLRDINQPSPTPTTPAPDWTPRVEMVEERLDRLLRGDNPLFVQARTRGLQAANRRGLLNSSIATQAAEQAMLDVALPIAGQDAATAAAANLSRQNFEQNRVLQADDIAAGNWRAQLDADVKVGIANMQVSASDREKIGALLATYQNQYASSYQAILNNENMTAEARQQNLVHIYNVMQSNLQLAEQLWGINLTWALPSVTGSGTA